jgi:hypothetical protein
VVKNFSGMFHILGDLFIVAFSPQVTKQQEGQQNEHDGQKHIVLNDMKKVQNNCQHRGRDSRDDVSI